MLLIFSLYFGCSPLHAAPNPAALFSHILSPNSGHTEYILYLKKKACVGAAGQLVLSAWRNKAALGSKDELLHKYSKTKCCDSDSFLYSTKVSVCNI